MTLARVVTVIDVTMRFRIYADELDKEYKRKGYISKLSTIQVYLNAVETLRNGQIKDVF